MPNKFVAFLKQHWPLILIVLVAAFLRFFRLDSLPPGLHPDEAANGLDIIGMIDQGKFAVVFDSNGPREGLFLYLQGFFVWVGQALSIASLNYTTLALRLAPALIGVLTVFGLYKLTKEFFNKNIALFSAAALAISSWHIQFSRNGFRAIMTPLVLVFLFYFFIKAYREGKIRDYVWAGAWLGLGFYTYLSFRMIPLVFLALLVFILVTDKKFFSKNLKKLGYFFLVFLVCMIPMVIHFFHVPADILGRASTSIFGQGGNPAMILADNILKTLQMFNFAGDSNFRHNVASLPMLEPIMGVLLWVGLLVACFRIKKIEYFILIVWAAVMSLPEIMTGEGIPHALRMVGVIPVVFIFVALGFDRFAEALRKLFKAPLKKFVPILAMVIFVLSLGAAVQKYFIIFPKSVEAHEAYAEDMVALAEKINAVPQGKRIILITGEYGTKTVTFLTHKNPRSFERYEVNDIKQIQFQGDWIVFVQKDWIDEAREKLTEEGIEIKLEPVPSALDGRSLIYESV